VQGSTDHGLLFNTLTGYLPTPSASLIDLKAYIDKYTPKRMTPRASTGGDRGKYITSYLKAIYGNTATKENDFGYAWLPKLDEGMNCSWLNLFFKMYQGSSKASSPGTEPACSTPAASYVRQAFGKLKWMVTVNLFDNETASFWRAPA